MKNFKIFSKKGVCLLLILALTIACIGPVAKVLATNYGDGENGLKFDFGDMNGFGLNGVTIDGVLWEDKEDEFFTEDGKHTVVITVSKDGDRIPDIRYGENWNENITKSVNVSGDGNTYTYTLNVTNPEAHGFLGLDIIEKPAEGQPDNPPAPGDQDEPGPGEGEGQRVISVDFGTAQWVIDGVTVNVVMRDVGTPNNGPVDVNTRDPFRVSNFDPNTMDMILYTDDGFNTRLSLLPDTDHETCLDTADTEGGIPSPVKFKVEKKQDDGGNNGGQVKGGPDDIEFDVKFTGTHVIITINDVVVVDDADGEFKDSFKGVIEGAGNVEGTNTLRIACVFGDLPITNLKINGVSYADGDENVKTIEGGYEVTVPGAAKYTITGEADENAQVARTIIWTNPNYVPQDAEDEEWIQEFNLDHGYAYVIAVYDEEGKLINPNEYKSENWVTNENGGGVGSNGFGWIAIHSGSRVIFEFVPEYGYQLTDIRINGQKLGVSGLMNQFEFEMPNTNIHFDAEFTKTSDVVEAGSKDIVGGKIELGGALEGGSAKLKVNDVELSTDQISNFEENAGDYKVSKYLNIELFNIYYKGKDDAEDVWEKQVNDMDKEATITLELEEGVDGNDIVIVHEKHDGTYEIIPATYDAENHTITFKTSSFSNYAIASKTVEEEETEIAKEDSQKEDINKEDNQSSNPQTGDIIYKVSSVLAVAIGVFAISFILAKNGKKKERKH